MDPQEVVEGEMHMGMHGCQLDLLALARRERRKEKTK